MVLAPKACEPAISVDAELPTVIVLEVEGEALLQEVETVKKKLDAGAAALKVRVTLEPAEILQVLER